MLVFAHNNYLIELIASLFMELWTGKMFAWPFQSPASTWLPAVGILTLDQMQRCPAAAPGSRSRLCLSWLSLKHKPLYLTDLAQASLNSPLLKGQCKTESPCRSIHPSFISAVFLFFFTPQPAKFTRFLSVILSYTPSSQGVKCNLVIQVYS